MKDDLFELGPQGERKANERAADSGAAPRRGGRRAGREEDVGPDEPEINGPQEHHRGN